MELYALINVQVYGLAIQAKIKIQFVLHVIRPVLHASGKQLKIAMVVWKIIHSMIMNASLFHVITAIYFAKIVVKFKEI